MNELLLQLAGLAALFAVVWTGALTLSYWLARRGR